MVVAAVLQLGGDRTHDVHQVGVVDTEPHLGVVLRAPVRLFHQFRKVSASGLAHKLRAVPAVPVVVCLVVVLELQPRLAHPLAKVPHLRPVEGLRVWFGNQVGQIDVVS